MPLVVHGWILWVCNSIARQPLYMCNYTCFWDTETSIIIRPIYLNVGKNTYRCKLSGITIVYTDSATVQGI